jgi:alkylhydroperoxidase family enzyme
VTDEHRLLPLLDVDTSLAVARSLGAPDSLAKVNLFRTVFRHPPIARIVLDMVDAIVLNSVLDARLREIAILRTGWRLGSVYEWSNHYGIGRRAGITDDEMRIIQAGPASTAAAPDARTVMQVVDEVLDGVAVSDATLHEAFAVCGGDERKLLELVMIPGSYRAIASALLTFGVPLEADVVPWAPDGLAPKH